MVALGVILLVEGVIFTILEVLNFAVTPEYGEEINRENPVTINVSDG